MFKCKTTITRPDRDRLVRTTQSKTNLLSWSLFIDELLREIDRARVIEPARVPNDTVTMHSTVRIRDGKRDAPEVYTLVYPDEAAPQLGKLSVFTAVGTALLGTRAGDVVRVATADGVRRIRIEGILYQPEAARREHAQPSAASESGVRATGHLDPVQTEQGRKAHAERLARTRAALRSARRGELMIVYALSALVLLTMLPAVLAIGAAWLIVMLWRHAKPWRRALRRQCARSEMALELARFAAGVLVRAVRAPVQARARALERFRCAGASPDRVTSHVSMDDKEADHEVSRVVRQHRPRARGYTGSASRTAITSLPRRIASVHSAGAT